MAAKLLHMRILFLGGTGFVGRHLAQAAITAGHDVIFFNRGVTDRTLFPGYEQLRGNRTGDLRALERIAVDVVIDTSGYTPDAVLATARLVAPHVRTYYFMSSVDVYESANAPNDESSPTKTLAAGESTSEARPELYGAQKARSERELIALLGEERVLVVRAGFMIGPHDNTDRFTYWPVRVARGGAMLAPVARDLPVQAIDVRDVADWSMHALAQGIHGTFNLMGMPATLMLGAVFDACIKIARVEPQIFWVPSEFLETHAIAPWVGMPLWIPDLAELRNFCSTRNDRALASGLHLRPLEETIHSILAEYAERPHPRTLRAGLDAEREASLLQLLGKTGDR